MSESRQEQRLRELIAKLPHNERWPGDATSKAHAEYCIRCQLETLLAEPATVPAPAEQQSKRMDILLDENCIETIKRLPPTGGEEISFGGVMGGVRLLRDERPATPAPMSLSAEQIRDAMYPEWPDEVTLRPQDVADRLNALLSAAKPEQLS